MNPLPISARRLLRRAIRLDDRLVRGVSMFPFFDRGGTVRHVMVLTSESNNLYLVTWRAQLFRFPMWGAVQLAANYTSLRYISEEDIKAITPLWHFDPWWVLKEDRYAGHWAVELLKTTNCARRLEGNVKRVYFCRDLSRLSHVAFIKHSQISLTRWQDCFLPPSQTPSESK